MATPRTPILTSGGSVIDFAALRGKLVLVNFWATWCAPCIYEMPSLDQLQLSHGSELAILPIAIDPEGKPAIRAFYERFHLTHLGIFADPDRQIGYLETANPGRGFLPVLALPITYVVDRAGAIRGYVPGPAQWNSSQAEVFLRYMAQL
ncbi:MAG: TlpA family protein disulfide reductase [Proteobacteria bacterium]|nr:TlpA family protein disulfide reductase [Pseudomonadota bacterium]